MAEVINIAALELKAKLFRGFADASRLAILEALRLKALSVTEVIQATGMSQSNISNHLRCLFECGLVSREQRGRFVYYRLSDERLEVLLALGSDLLRDLAKGVYECVNYGEPSRELESEDQ